MKKYLYFATFLGLLITISCKEEDLTIKSIELNLKEASVDYDMEIALTVSTNPAGAIAPEFIWESEETEIASVSNTGKVKGLRVGETTITVMTSDSRFSSSCKLTVNPTNFLYKEPVLDFSSSKQAIKQKETRTIMNDEDALLMYEDENSYVRYIAYFFEENTLNFAGVFLEPQETIIGQTMLFLNQRYEYVGREDEVDYYSWNEVDVLVYVSSYGLAVLYVPSDSGARIKCFDTKIIDQYLQR